MPYRFLNFGPQFFDSSGDVLSGGKLYFKESGSDTLKNTYQESGLSTPNARSGGERAALVWLSPRSRRRGWRPLRLRLINLHADAELGHGQARPEGRADDPGQRRARQVSLLRSLCFSYPWDAMFTAFS